MDSTTRRQRVVLRSSATSHHRKAPSARPGVAVPEWFDLPLLLPDSDSVLARIQRQHLNTIGGEYGDADATATGGSASATGFHVPKISRLSPQKERPREAPSESGTEREKHVAMQRYMRQRKGHGQTKLRRTLHDGAPIVLDRLNYQRSRLRDKLWKDLQRFGLWHINGVGGEEEAQETETSVNAAVESIMTQLGATLDPCTDNTASTLQVSGNNHTTDDDDLYMDVTETELHRFSRTKNEENSVFLTAVPADPTNLASVRSGVEGGNQAGELEFDDDEGDDVESQREEGSEASTRAFREIAAPGLRRRQRLKDLHQYVEKQLQKRLYRSWETIEIALSGSGDLTVNQIVKFLQNSDVKLSAVDAVKVQSILQSHVDQQTAQSAAECASAAAQCLESSHVINDEATSNVVSSTPSGKPKSKKGSALSYEAFRKIFHPKDSKETIQWRREFDREKARQRQEREIYEKELAALEEKVKKRLAESAKQMVEILDHFRCDPLAIPWENDQQRLELRAHFLHIVFSKPARRGISSMASLKVSGLKGAPGDSRTENEPIEIPEKLSVPQVRSALLQKYSRNGHFDTIEVPAAAYIFHDIAVDRVKKSIQDLWKRREADQWPERQLIFQFRLKKEVFHEWRRFATHAAVLRVYVLRKFVAWAYHTRKRYEYYAFFRACFWPFYVWKRHLQQMIIARGKSVFLKNLVVTYNQLQHFRAWKQRFRKKMWYRRQVVRQLDKKKKWVKRIVWDAWLGRLATRLQIHRLWKSHGHVMQHLHKNYMVRVTFYLWRYFTILRGDMRARRFKCFHMLFPPANGSRRAQQQHQSALPRRGAPAKGKEYSPQRGTSWYPGSTVQTTGPVNRSVSMVPGVGTPVSLATLTNADLDIDAVIDDDVDVDVDGEVEVDNGRVRGLSKIMETDLAPKIKRKTRLYDLCLDLYLQYRERDRRVMTGNIILYRRVGRAWFRGMQHYILYVKKNRMATDVGAFRVLLRRFRAWVAVSIYKYPLLKTDSTVASVIEGSENQYGDEDEGSQRTILEVKEDRIQLDWKNDTEWRQHGLEFIPVEAEQLHDDLRHIAEEQVLRLLRLQELDMAFQERKRQEEIFLRKEVASTMKVRSMQMQQAQQVLRTRAHRMHDVLDRVYDDLLARKKQCQLKSSFRGLRITMMERYTTTICHRAQLRNWLRLAKRFVFWERNMLRFYHMKLKYHVFRTLLRHAVWKWKNESYGHSAALQRRQQRIWLYERYLEAHGLLTGTSSAARIAVTKYSPANSFHGVFLRWVQFTQLSKSYQEMIATTHRKRDLWRLHSVFQTLKTYLKAKYTLASRRRRVPYLFRQCEADLDALHCKIVALRARLPSTNLRRQLKLTQRHYQQTATGAPTLKQLFQQHEQEVKYRLFLENRLMFVAYNERRVHHYAERSTQLYGAPIGRVFAYEKAPHYGSISEVIVLCGKKVDGLSLVLKTNANVTSEGLLHGNPFGNREVFALGRGERLVGIEGYASQTVYGLRFTTNTGRHSKWFGHCEKGTRFELRSEWTSKREEIVGFHGYADGTSIHAIGCVFRHTTLKNIFEGMWLQSQKVGVDPATQVSTTSAENGSGLGAAGANATTTADGATTAVGGPRSSHANEDMSLCDRQFAYFLQVRTCDVLGAMQRAHRFALRVHRMAHLPWALTRSRMLMGIMRWFFNSLAHGLVHHSDREEEGKRILQDGMNKRAMGERLVDEGTRLLAEVDAYRDEERQLNVATLGVRKLTELREMIEQGEHKIHTGRRMIEDGQAETLAGRRILPHIPMTRRMMSAIRRMYKVVQTKDYIDQMDPELRAILLEGDAAATDTPTSIYEQL